MKERTRDNIFVTENITTYLGVRIEVHSGRIATCVAWAAEMERACDIIIKIVHEVIPEVSSDASCS